MSWKPDWDDFLSIYYNNFTKDIKKIDPKIRDTDFNGDINVKNVLGVLEYFSKIPAQEFKEKLSNKYVNFDVREDKEIYKEQIIQFTIYDTFDYKISTIKAIMNSSILIQNHLHSSDSIMLKNNRFILPLFNIETDELCVEYFMEYMRPKIDPLLLVLDIHYIITKNKELFYPTNFSILRLSSIDVIKDINKIYKIIDLLLEDYEYLLNFLTKKIYKDIDLSEIDKITKLNKYYL